MQNSMERSGWEQTSPPTALGAPFAAVEPASVARVRPRPEEHPLCDKVNRCRSTGDKIKYPYFPTSFLGTDPRFVGT